MTFGETQVHANIVVILLLNGEQDGPNYITMAEALEKECLVVTEGDHEGSVPDLKVKTTADTPILLLDGKELAGASQQLETSDLDFSSGPGRSGLLRSVARVTGLERYSQHGAS